MIWNFFLANVVSICLNNQETNRQPPSSKSTTLHNMLLQSIKIRVIQSELKSTWSCLPRWNVWGRPPLQPGLQRTVSESLVSRDTRQSSGAPGKPENNVL